MEDLLKVLQNSEDIKLMGQRIWNKVLKKTGYSFLQKQNNRVAFNNEKEALFAKQTNSSNSLAINGGTPEETK